MLKKLKILLLVNEPVFLTGLKTILKSIPGQEIVGVIHKVEDIEESCIQYKPDVIFIRDYLFNKDEGLKAIEIVKRSFPEIKVIMIMSWRQAALINEAKKLGADSCLFTNDDLSQFNSCLWNTMQGKNQYPLIEDVI